jgi:hypothetical protein
MSGQVASDEVPATPGRCRRCWLLLLLSRICVGARMRYRWWQCTKSSSRQRRSCRRPCGSCRWSMWRRRRQPNPRTCRVAANQRGRHSVVGPLTVGDREAFAKEFRYGLLQLRLTIAELDSLSPDTQTCEQDACVSYSVYRRDMSRDDRYTAVGKMFLAAPLEETRSALQSKCSKLDDALQLHAVTRIPPTRPPTHRSSALSLMSVLLFPVRAP